MAVKEQIAKIFQCPQCGRIKNRINWIYADLKRVVNDAKKEGHNDVEFMDLFCSRCVVLPVLADKAPMAVFRQVHQLSP